MAINTVLFLNLPCAGEQPLPTGNWKQGETGLQSWKNYMPKCHCKRNYR